MSLSALLAAAVISAHVTIDPSSTAGPVKVMNAVNNGPIAGNSSAYKELKIPYARTHDTALGESYGRFCIDINCIFPDWGKSADNPRNYDFAVSDKVIADMVAVGTEPFFRLGQSIEHQVRKYFIYPPKDSRKWARICEHIIRHYNEGWADGFHYNIRYWEIWNEPDLDSNGQWNTNPRTWGGTQEQFYELYETAARHLKKCFPDLMIGGPAFSGSYDLKCVEPFLAHMEEHKVPIDFLSWHRYSPEPASFVKRARRIRKLLDDHGYSSTPSFMDEWNYNKSWDEKDFYSARVRSSLKAGAFVASVMCACQKEPVDMLMYYDFRPNTNWNGVFKAFVYDKLPAYYAFLYWSKLLDAGTQIKSKSDSKSIYTCAARDADGNLFMIVSRYHEDDSITDVCTVDIAIPEGYSCTSCRMTGREGDDRAVIPVIKDGCASLDFGPNAFALIEFKK